MKHVPFSGARRSGSWRPRLRQTPTLLLTLGLLGLTPGALASAPLPAALPATEGERAPVSRESALTFTLSAPDQARELVLAHTLPSGAAFVPGSAVLTVAAVGAQSPANQSPANQPPVSQPLADPAVGPSGRLYWTLPALTRGVLTYQVSHAEALGALPEPALLVRYSGAREEVLMGTLDAADLKAARAPAPALAEPSGLIRSPRAETVYRERDRISVVVQGALGADLTLSVNGVAVPERQIGTRTTDEGTGTERREYVGVPLTVGENRLSVGGESLRVFYAGPTARVEVTGAQLLADGSTPLRLRVRALDALGVPTAQPFVTVRPSLEPLAPDANPQEGGYQVRLQEGEGVLELRPQAVPARLVLDVVVGERVQRETFEVTPDPAEVGVGYASVTFGVQPLALESWRVAAAYEGMVGSGKLYLGADSRGLPTKESLSARIPTFGDASTEAVPLQGVDPVALRYEHPAFSVAYRQGTPPVDVLPLPGGFTALSASTRGDSRVSGFVALLPREEGREVLTPDGTRLYRLSRAPISPDSETVQVVTTEAGSGLERARLTLVRGADYSLDPETGVLTLSAPLARLDTDLNPVSLEVSYRAAAPLTNRALAWGVQAKTERGAWSAGAAAVQLGGVVTSGAKVTYASGPVSAGASAAYSGGAQVSAEAAARWARGAAGFKVRYQQPGYVGLGAFEPGLSASASAAVSVAKGVSVAVDGTYRLSGAEGGAPADGGPVSSGQVTGVVKLARGPVAVSAGVRAGLGREAGLTAIGSVGLRSGRFGVDVGHTQPLTSADAATTSVGASVTLTPDLTLSARNEIDWDKGQRPSVGLSGRLGGANFNASYDLPTASGEGNRARFGVDAARPLSDKVTVGLAVTELYDFKQRTNELSVSPAVRYKSDTVSAALGTDFSVRGGALKTVLRGGLSVSATERLTLSADGLAELGAAPGARLSVAGAYRAPQLSALGYLRYQQGSLAGGRPELSGEVQAELSRARWGVRAGVAGRQILNDPGSLTWQPSVGATAALTDFFGLGLAARALLQPATGSALYGFGIEGRVRALPGTWLTLGYNPLGFEGIGQAYSKRGLYLRADVLLDERMGERK